ncbi:hypothetical protein HGRIS_013149 [Hohenbuehelia grisea]|uniref:Uncharacterized protein n=1 Tax=Hohenbuehelia grisea TaxID=104357 RepID=A0ABR3IUT0_9AGAR
MSHSGMQSPRQETPEPASIQGRRNFGVHLLDDEGDISDQVGLPHIDPDDYYCLCTCTLTAPQLEVCLKHIFGKYCTPPPSEQTNSPRTSTRTLLVPPEDAYFTSEGLDAWARDTNGAPFSEEQKEEIQLLDVTDEGYLTFKGFLQIYQLQTENDEEETWRDLSSHGFDRSLKLVSSRREDEEGDAA